MWSLKLQFAVMARFRGMRNAMMETRRRMMVVLGIACVWNLGLSVLSQAVHVMF
jgi:hypothetical protein